MATTISSAGAIDPVLSKLFYERFNQDDVRVGRFAAPFRKIQGISGQYHQLGGSGKYGLNLDETDDEFAAQRLEALSWNAASRPLGQEYTTGSVSLKRYATHVFLNDRISQHWRASGDVDILASGIAGLSALVLDRHNYHVLTDVYGTTGNYGSTVNGPDMDTPGNLWFDEVNVAKQTILAATGFRPTHAICSLQVADLLADSDQMQTRPAGTGNLSGMIGTNEMLSAWFMQKWGLTLLIDEGYYENSANANTSFMGDTLAIVRLANDGTPSFCNTFVQDIQGFNETTIAGIREVRTQDPLGSKMIADVAYDVSVEVAAAGYGILSLTS